MSIRMPVLTPMAVFVANIFVLISIFLILCPICKATNMATATKPIHRLNTVAKGHFCTPWAFVEDMKRLEARNVKK